jgi:hypothetical protein
MSYRNFTFEISEEECVGNSAGKHNFNALNLEANICNLIHEFETENLETTTYNSFNLFFQQAPDLQAFKAATRYNTAYTTVQYLSAYWEKKELSILYPVNISPIGNQTINSPTASTPLTTLIGLSKAYLTLNFPASSFKQGTKLHVNMFPYSYAPNSPDKQDLFTETNTAFYSFYNRTMVSDVTRKSVHFANPQILTFHQFKNDWMFIGVAGPMQPEVDPTKPRKTVILTISKNVTNYDVSTNVKADANYVAGNTDIVVKVESGVIISSRDATTPALNISNLTGADSVILFNYGSILGAGGEGGAGGNSAGVGDIIGHQGQRGGTAIAAFAPTTIENHGIIYAGAGGGAGGQGSTSGNSSVGGGGGGGAGTQPGPGGYRGQNRVFKNANVKVRDGSIGASSTGGKGGPGLGENSKSSGGDGGNLGMPGQSVNGVSGGEAGYYILGNPSVYWAIRGDVAGNAI